MFVVYFGILLFIAGAIEAQLIDSSVGEASYESTEFVDPEPNRTTNNGSRVIFPGTKWCGAGNIASSNEDLGTFEDLDKCCRAHDNCEGLSPGESRYGLTNDSPFSKLHCSCDRAFYKCLKNDNQIQSNIVGEMYFIANEKCYKKAHPIIGCETYKNFMWIRRCVKYRVDTTKPKIYQFMDLPFYDDVESSLQRQRSAKSCNVRMAKL